MNKDVRFEWFEFDAQNKGSRKVIVITDVPGENLNEIFCNADNQFAFMYPEVDSTITVSQEIL